MSKETKNYYLDKAFAEKALGWKEVIHDRKVCWSSTKRVSQFGEDGVNVALDLPRINCMDHLLFETLPQFSTDQSLALAGYATWIERRIKSQEIELEITHDGEEFNVTIKDKEKFRGETIKGEQNGFILSWALVQAVLSYITEEERVTHG